MPTLCRYKMLRAVLFLVLSLALPAAGGDFYSARVPVPPGNEETQRTQGLRAALQVVVRQVTGDPRLAANPKLEREYQAASRYAREYRFADGPRGRELQASFDPAAVDAMLRRYGLAPRSERPAVLAWLAGPAEGGDQLLLTEPNAGLWAALEEAAIENGISLLVPLMDMEDQVALPPADISARVSTTVRDASVRYGPDAVLSAYLSGGGDLWQADWMLLSGETVRRWSTRGERPSAALASGMGDAAGILTTMFPTAAQIPLDLRLPPVTSSAPAAAGSTTATGVGEAPADHIPESMTTITPIAGGEGDILVRVAGIAGPADYSRAISAFRDKPVIARFRVLAAEPDAVVVAVTSSAGEQAVAAALEASGILDGEPSGAAMNLARGISLYFRLKP